MLRHICLQELWRFFSSHINNVIFTIYCYCFEFRANIDSKFNVNLKKKIFGLGGYVEK